MIADFKKHLTDQEFFTYIKFIDLIIDKKNLEDEDLDEVSVYRFSIGDDNEYKRFSRLYEFVRYEDLPVLISYSSPYEKLDEIVASYKQDKKDSNYPSKKEIEEIYQKIQNNKTIKFSETGKFSWAWHGIYNSTRFKPDTYKISDSTKEKVKKDTEKYLENLINDELSIVKNNYYRFEVLKNLFIKLIEQKNAIRLYGKNFVIKEEITKHGDLKKDPNFCLIQTVYALQQLGYLTVNNVWRDYEGSDDLRNIDKYFVSMNITVSDLLISEMNVNYKKENPKTIITSFNKEKGVLKFAEEEISLSMKGKETDSSLLMNILYEKEDTGWVYNDEIYEIWGFNTADIERSPKDKIYQAARKINQKVAMQTKIDDLIEYTTKSVRINPRYRKVDE